MSLCAIGPEIYMILTSARSAEIRPFWSVVSELVTYTLRVGYFFLTLLHGRQHGLGDKPLLTILSCVLLAQADYFLSECKGIIIIIITISL